MMKSRKVARQDGGKSQYPSGSHGDTPIWLSREDVSRHFNIYINDTLEEPADHTERIDLIRSAEETDTITLILTTPGGRIDIAEGYLDAIENSAAKINTRAVGCVASAGTQIWLAGDERTASERSYFMFHNAQMGLEGEAKNLAVSADFYSRLFEDIYGDIYSDVLTEDELKKVFNGGEVYLRGTEMQRRVDAIDAEQEARGVVSGEDTGPSRRAITIKLDSGFKKDVFLDTLSIHDFGAFTVAEMKGILQNIGAEPEKYLGVRKWETLAETVVKEIETRVKNGG